MRPRVERPIALCALILAAACSHRPPEEPATPVETLKDAFAGAFMVGAAVNAISSMAPTPGVLR